MKNRSEIAETHSDGESSPRAVSVLDSAFDKPAAAPVADRLDLLDDAGYYAQLENIGKGKTIKIYAKDGTLLFGLNPEMIAFEAEVLTIAVQVYVMAYNQAHKTGYEVCKNKLSELVKLCL
jgi:hypothetical protein